MSGSLASLFTSPCASFTSSLPEETNENSMTKKSKSRTNEKQKQKGKGKGKKGVGEGEGEKKTTALQNLFNPDTTIEFVRPRVELPDIEELKRLKEERINPKKLNKKAKKRLLNELKISDFGETSDQEEEEEEKKEDNNETDQEYSEEEEEVQSMKSKKRKTKKKMMKMDSESPPKRRKVSKLDTSKGPHGEEKEEDNYDNSNNDIKVNDNHYDNKNDDNDDNDDDEEIDEESENELEETLKELGNKVGRQGIDADDLVDNEKENESNSEDDKIDKKEKLGKDSNSLDSRTNIDTERNERTIFVGNLPVSIKKQAISSMFEKFGTIESIRLRSVAVAPVKIDEKGNNKLLLKVASNKKLFDTEIKDTFNAYIVFDKATSIEEALKLHNTLVSGKHIKVDRVGTNSNLQDPLRSVFIGNVYFKASEEELRTVLMEALKENDDEYQEDSYFDTCIESVRIVRNTEDQLGKGFAFALLRDKVLVSKLLRIKSPIKLNKRDLRISACGKRTKGQRGETTMTRAEKRALKFGGTTPLPGAKGRLQKKLAKAASLAIAISNTNSNNRKDRKAGKGGKGGKEGIGPKGKKGNNRDKGDKGKGEGDYNEGRKVEIGKTKRKNFRGGEEGKERKRRSYTTSSKIGGKGKEKGKAKIKAPKIGKKRTADGKKIRLAGKRNDPNSKKSN